MNDTELESRFGEHVVSELLELHAPPETPTPKPGAKSRARRVAKGQIFDAGSNIRGVLGAGKAQTPADICRQTGLLPEQCAAGLCALEADGVVRRVEGGKWEMVFP